MLRPLARAGYEPLGQPPIGLRNARPKPRHLGFPRMVMAVGTLRSWLLTGDNFCVPLPVNSGPTAGETP